MKKMAMICLLSSGLVAGLFIFYQMEICRYKETSLFIRDAFVFSASDGGRIERLKDAWGRPMSRKVAQNGMLIYISSSGHDGKFDTKDDIIGVFDRDGDGYSLPIQWQYLFDSENRMDAMSSSRRN